jgi:hypothetical protein
MMRRLTLVAALVAVAALAAACDRPSDKPARGAYVGGGGGVSVPS